MGGGLYADVAILAALHHREKTGEGQFLDISMQDCIWAMTTVEAAGAYFIEGRVPQRIGNPLNPCPFLGENNSEIYADLLGLSEEKISDLMEKEVI